MRLACIANDIAGKKIVNSIIKIYKAIKEMNQVFQDLIIQCNNKLNWIIKINIK